MTIETTYTCDHCNSSWRVSGRIYGVAVVVERDGRQYTSRAGPSLQYTRHWCKPCLKKFGLVPQPKDDAPDPLPTLEDLIIEIARDVAHDAVHGG